MFLLQHFFQNGSSYVLYINVGHFSGLTLANKNMTKRLRVWNLFLYWDTTGFYLRFDKCVGLSDHLRIYHWEQALGIWG